MFKESSTIVRLGGAILIAGAAVVFTALSAAAQVRQLPMEPIHQKGQAVTPSYEGWWQSDDGNYNFLLGYFNRNAEQEVDIPVGPNNHIDPGGDYGQPTHFYPRRHWGVYVLTLPKDIATGPKKPAWTLTVNGVTTTIPVNIDPVFNINPFSEIGIGNTPPTISLDEKGPSVQGPKAIVVSRTATVGTPLPITVWAADDDKSLRPQGGAAGGRGRGGAPPPAAGAPAFQRAPAHVGIIFEAFRGPGKVTFADARPKVEQIENGTIPKAEKFNGKAATTATFSAPGEYYLRIYAIDSSGEGGGGFLCCWTNSEMKVTVQ